MDSPQKVEVHLNFIGEFLPQEDEPLTAEQEEELRKKLANRERLRRNYQRYKNSDKYKEWQKRYEPIRKARLEATKAALLAEGAVLGANAAAPFTSSAS